MELRNQVKILENRHIGYNQTHTHFPTSGDSPLPDQGSSSVAAGNVTHALERRRAQPGCLSSADCCGSCRGADRPVGHVDTSVAEAAHSPNILIIVLGMLQISLLRQFDDHGWPQKSFIEEGLIEGWLAVE